MTTPQVRRLSLDPKPAGKLPMVMEIDRTTLLWLVNQQFSKENKPVLDPKGVQITLEFKDRDPLVLTDADINPIVFRWEI